MSFENSKEFIQSIKTNIDHGHDQELLLALGELHPADVAEVLDDLSSEHAGYVYRLLDKELAADVLIELEEDVREKLMRSLTSREIAEEVIERMESDDAADVIAELPTEKKEQVIAHLEDQEQASDIIDLLNYEEGTAGALMAKELMWVNANWTVANCIRQLRKQAEDVEQIYTIYVVDDKDVLLGRLSLKRLLFSAQSTRALVSDIFEDENLVTVNVQDDEQAVARVMEKYDLVTVPVINDGGVLVGRITIDDVVDVIMEEAEKDYQLASGLAEDVESKDNIWTLTRARLPWLLIGMAGGLLGAKVIGVFDIEENPMMALFIPLIAAMGGNVGVQSAAIVVQGLANNSLKNEQLSAKLLKELGVGALNGFICSVLLLGTSYLLDFGYALCLTVSIALFAVIIFAALFGTFIPLALDKYKIDPALATGPFITTANDIIGLIIYFSVAQFVAHNIDPNFLAMAF
ncbi:MAG: magnesium transporter [Flavobacteriales bacterium]|nr:magnesium transporter [Flavobacteriales bacterium]